MQNLSLSELGEIRRAAQQFKREARWTPPRFATGHRIDHEDPAASACNWSTRTRIVKLSSGRQIFLIYRYTFSWMHVLFDNFLRLFCGRKSAKTLTESHWHVVFEDKSRIAVYNIAVKSVVALRYVPNYNLWDVLHNNYGQLRSDDVWVGLLSLCIQINRMHAGHRTWGDMIVNNVILERIPRQQQATICDTEVSYWGSVSFVEQCARDWRELIISVVGCDRHFFPDKAEAARKLFNMIEDRRVRVAIQKWAATEFRWGKGHLTFWQKALWPGYGGQLSTSLEDYILVRETLADAPIDC